MKPGLPKTRQRIQACVILAIFLSFAANAFGLASFHSIGFPGVALHAHLLGELLAGRLPPLLGGPDFLVFLVVGSVLALVLPRLKPIGASAATLLSALPPFYVAWAYPLPPAVVPLEYSLLCILVLFSVKVLLSYFIETRDKQKIMSVFGQYVPPALVQDIARHPESFSMAGEARQMTVLFCDVLDFSGISEKLEPEALTSLLNEYLTAMTDVLHRHGATIDKYIGDAVMAFWGAPLPQPDHAARALAAALDMQRVMKTLRETFRARGWPGIAIGIGVSTGVVNVGNMGSRYRVAYTVVGDAVNIAARLEALTRLYGVEVLVSEATRVACAEAQCREIDHVRLKGKDRATRLFEPCAGGDSTAVPDDHQAGLDAYYRGDWEEARRVFSRIRGATAHPAYYDAMLARMADGAPPARWNGIITFSSSLNYSMEPEEPPAP